MAVQKINTTQRRLRILGDEELEAIYGLPRLTDQERLEYFALAPTEKAALAQFHSIPSQIYFILQLGYFKAHPMFFVFSFPTVAQDARYIQKQYFPRFALTKLAITKVTRLKQQRVILALFHYRSCNAEQRQALAAKARQAAMISAKPVYVFRELLHYLREQRIVAPGYSFLQDTVGQALTHEQERLATVVSTYLTPAEQEALDRLLEDAPGRYAITQLRHEPKDFSASEIKREIHRGEHICDFYRLAQRLLPQLAISNEGIKYYATLVGYYSVYKLKRFDESTTYLYLLCFVYHRYQRLHDHLLSSLIHHVRRHSDGAKEAAKDRVYEHRVESNENLHKAGHVLKLFTDDPFRKWASLRFRPNRPESERCPYLYVTIANFGDGSVLVIDTATESVTEIPLRAAADAVAINPDGTRAYAIERCCRFGNASVAVIDTAINMVIDRIELPRQGQGIAVTADGSFVCVADFDSQLLLIDTSTNRIVGGIRTGLQPSAVAVIDQLTPRQSIFLVHGIAQDGGENGDLRNFARSLRASLDAGRFLVDAGFDYGYCANRTTCADTCGIRDGGDKLATYIASRRPVGDIIVVGYSLGGLFAREMMLNHAELFMDRGVEALITIGTPNLGYAWTVGDFLGRCERLTTQMFGDFRNRAEGGWIDLCLRDDGSMGNCGGGGQWIAAVSQYLYDLNRLWTSTSFPGEPAFWYTMAGTSCNTDRRQFPPGSFKGCADNTRNDNVVCRQSASFDWTANNGPVERWEDPEHNYAHTDGRFLLFCPFEARYPLWNPASDPNNRLLSKLRGWINALP